MYASDTACREDKKILMASVLAHCTGKAVVQVTAIEISVNDLLPIRSPEAVLTLCLHYEKNTS